VVRQNLACSMVYIIVLLALSAYGYIPPIVAVLLHVLSSFVVIFNSARLVREGEELEMTESPASGPAPGRPTPPTPLPAGATPAMG